MPKFLHAADLHIDSPLRSLETYEGAPKERIRGATREAFEKLIAFAIQEEVRFVILAGDVFDTNPLLATSVYFNRALQELTTRGIPVFIARGNHDHAGIVPRGRTLVEGVHIFSHDYPETFELEDVAIHGQSYPSAAVHLDLSLGYPAPIHGKLNIGVLHTSLLGYPEHEPYAPTSPKTLAARGYGYWALGHVHRFEHLVEGGTTIVFPGNLQGRHARETGPKGAVLVEYEGNRILSVKHQSFDVTRWHLLEVDLAEGDDETLLRSLVRSIEEASATDRMEKRLAVFRLRLWTHRDLGFDLRERLIEALTHLEGEVWIEKIELRRAPDHRASSEFLSALGELTDQLLADPHTLDELEARIESEHFGGGTPSDQALLKEARARAFGEGGDRDLAPLLASALELIASYARSGKR